MFEDYKGVIDLDLVLKESYNYKYDSNNLEDFYNQDFIEMEGNGLTAMCWIKYQDNKYLFKPIKDSCINIWGELLSNQLAKQIGIPCCNYRAGKLGNKYGVITEKINKKEETLILGSEIIQEFFDYYPEIKKKYITEMLTDPKNNNCYNQQHHLFNHLNNLEQIWFILSSFDNIKKNNSKNYNFSTLNQEAINSIITFLSVMLIFDIVTLQADRNVNNWAVLYNTKEFKPCPLYDNAISFGLGYNNMKERVHDFRNQVLNYKYFNDDINIQSYIYKPSPLFTLSSENKNEQKQRKHNNILKVFDEFLTKLDDNYKEIAYYLIQSIEDENFSNLITKTEIENGIVMDAEVRFYIESTMKFHYKYLNEIINKHKVRSSINAK